MRFFYTFLISILALNAHAQMPAVQWQKIIGGSGDEGPIMGENYTRVLITPDKGYVIMGVTTSTDGNVGPGFGESDVFVAKYNSVGTLQWTKRLGGNGLDFAHDIRNTSDGGLIIAATTGSTNEEFAQRFGDAWDVWLIKLSYTGELEWQNFYGGTANDWGMCITETADGFVGCGRVESNNGLVTGNHGVTDIWVFKVDKKGVFQWQHSYGNNQLDVPFSINKTQDGGFIIGGYQVQPGPYGALITAGDFQSYVIKTDASGNLMWERKYGGTYYEDIRKIIPTSDGGYIFVGTTKSNDGDVSGNHPAYMVETEAGGYAFDMWVVKLNNSGDIVWQKPLGGNWGEMGHDVAEVSNGYYIGGFGHSNNGDLTGNHGYNDAWLVKLNSSGEMLSQRAYGGSDVDVLHSLAIINDNELILSGTTYSSNGDVIPNSGGLNIWMFKVSDQPYRFNTLMGNVYIDANANGYRDGTESDYDNQKIFIKDRFGFTASFDNQSTGFFNVNVDTGYYETSIASTAEYRAVPIRNISHFTTYSNSNYFGFGMIPTSLVSDMYVFMDTSVSVARPGLTITHYPTFNYYGTRTTLDAIVKIVKDPRLSYVSSTVPLFAVNNDTLSFRVNNLEPGFFNNFGISFSVPSSPVILPGDSLKFYLNVMPLVIDSAYFNNWDTVIQVVQPPINTIIGNVYLDNNGNNTWDVGEPVFEDGVVTSEKNAVSVFSEIRAGAFKNLVDTGTYATKVSFYYPYYTTTPVSRNSVFNTYYNTDSFDFAVRPIAGIRDLVTVLIPVFNAKPGFDNSYFIYYANKGTDTVTSVSLKFILDSRMTYQNSDSTPDEIRGDTLVWNLGTIYPLNEGSIIVEVKIKAPPIVNMSDTLKVVSIIEPLANDQQPANNLSEVNQIVVGSFDPNDKTESHSGKIEYSKINNGEYLNYTIRFQNTGNDTAFNIAVIDTLESKLDVKSFEMIASSHPYTMNVSQGKIYQWNFGNILLPDSNTNESKSHGYIIYRIRPINNIAIGETISNAASIYFDFNLPVKTNTERTTIINDNSIVCPGAPTFLNSKITGVSYQWQVNTGNGYENLSDNINYQGSSSTSLQVSGSSSSWYGYTYRCAVNTGTGIIYSNLYVLKFMNTWRGTVSNLWNNPANWSCGLVPDENTDVIINAGTSFVPEINANISVRSLTVKPGAAVTVKNGFSITIKK